MSGSHADDLYPSRPCAVPDLAAAGRIQRTRTTCASGGALPVTVVPSGARHAVTQPGGQAGCVAVERGPGIGGSLMAHIVRAHPTRQARRFTEVGHRHGQRRRCALSLDSHPALSGYKLHQVLGRPADHGYLQASPRLPAVAPDLRTLQLDVEPRRIRADNLGGIVAQADFCRTAAGA